MAVNTNQTGTNGVLVGASAGAGGGGGSSFNAATTTIFTTGLANNGGNTAGVRRPGAISLYY